MEDEHLAGAVLPNVLLQTLDPLASCRHPPEGPLGVRPVPEGVKDLLDGHNGAALPVGGLPHHAVGSLEGRKVGDDIIAIWEG